MPYKDMEDLPDAVKELPEDLQAQWLEVFNSAQASCLEDGGEEDKCEESAFAQAWSVVNKAQEEAKKVGRHILTTIWRAIQDAAVKLGFTVPASATERSALPMDQLYEQVYVQLGSYYKDAWYWLHSIYIEPNTKDLYAVVSLDGKLYRHLVSFDPSTGDVILSEPLQVVMEYMPVQQAKTRMVLRQQPDGRYRWFTISSVSVLNRSGEIDSRALYDSMIAYADAAGEYPVRMFYHSGEGFRTGQCDFMARDENCLITSGLYDDTTLARAEVKARQENPEFWGDSIGFIPTAEPAKVELADGVSVAVYTQGICREISTLPETDAASLMTGAATISYEEVTRMLDERKFKALSVLFGSEDEARAWIEENPEARNRAIQEAGMITRADDATPDPDPAAPQTEPAPVTPQVLELDEAAITRLATEIMGLVDTTSIAQGAADLLTERFTALDARLDKLESLVTGAADAVRSIQAVKADERLKLLERDEAAKQKEWQQDAPANRLQVTYRPRGAAPQAEEQGDPAAEILDNIPVRY